MQPGQTGDRALAAVAMEPLLPSSTATHAGNETLIATRTSNAEAQWSEAPVHGAPPTGSEKHTDVISILLVDDHALMREGLRQLLAMEQDLRIVGEAVDGFDALQKIRALHPEVVLMDISMPVVDGVAVTRQITHEFPST